MKTYLKPAIIAEVVVPQTMLMTSGVTPDSISTTPYTPGAPITII